MSWVLVQMKESNLLSPSQQPYFLVPPQPILDGSGGFNLDSKVSPSVMLIIIILSIVFFISGLLHLLVRFLLRPPTRDADDLESVTALQGQLQQLFHLHDAGVDQAFIDTLPVFEYKTIIGLKNPFDCAVCLSEFDDEDELRLLPKCSHAFHMECIDRWLLSHSTCPICRASLLPDFSPRNPTCSPIVLVLESGSESSREIGNDRDFSQIGRSNSVLTTNSHLGLQDPSEFGSIRFDASRKSCEMLPEMEDDSVPATPVEGREKVIAVKLGKYRNVDSIGDGSSNKSVDARRCYSMGSFEYVLDENTQLQVPIRTPMKKQSSKKPSLPLTPGHRSAMSLCDCESRRDFASLAGIKNIEKYGSGSVADTNGNAIGRSRRDSFSISKIWARGKKGKQSTEDGSRRAFSFRFPANKSSIVEDDSKTKNEDCGARRTNSEMGIGRWWENAGSELEYDEKNQSFNSLNTEPAAAAAAATPSFARRTLLWLAGRQNKVVHSSFTPNNV